MKVESIVGSACTLGEGPVWDEVAGMLYWVDIKAPAIWRYDPATGSARSWPMPHRIGAIALRRTGGIVAAMKPGFAFVDLDTGAVDIIAAPEAGLPDNRFNDGACDMQGRFWAGTMDDLETSPTGHIYRLDPGHAVTRFHAGFIVTNGLRWSGDGTRLYVVDSVNRTIWCWAQDPVSGIPGARRVFARLGEADGWPDGLCVDAQDHVWSAHWGGGRITRYNPDGVPVLRVDIPAVNVTSCCFGGPALDTLYVTTARIGVAPEALSKAPHTGNLFRVTGLGVQGRPSPRFAG